MNAWVSSAKSRLDRFPLLVANFPDTLKAALAYLIALRA